MAERSYKAIVDKMKADQQVEIDAEQAKLVEIQGLEPAIEADILAAENAILENVGQANGDDKLYSDKEWNDREAEFKTAQEAKDAELARIGKLYDDAKPAIDAAVARAEKAEQRLADAKANYAKAQEAESALEAPDAIFGKDEEVVVEEPVVEEPVSEEPQQ